MRMKKFIKKSILYSYEFIRDVIYRANYRVNRNKLKVNSVATIEETLDEIIEHKMSVSRFGDGEFKWMLGVSQKSFEDNSEELSKLLIEVIQSNEKGHLVCVSPALAGLDYTSKRAKKYWETMLGKCGARLLKYLDRGRKYYNANITRFYINDVNKSKVNSRFEHVRLIWEKRSVLIVEGTMSRLGVGNDLFDNAVSVRRIIAPAKNAFQSYSDILNCVEEEYKPDDLVLIALGPTATVMAYDLAKKGIQAIDIGHIDIEYEWYLHGADNKVAIPGKAVNEAIEDRSSEKFDVKIWNKYCSEIIARVG